MRCTHCEKCCQDTRMELCEVDMVRLERVGHSRDRFSCLGKDGVSRLRNVDGFCCFYDRVASRCKVYSRRPLGCVIYPVNMTSEGKVIVDPLCPEADKVSHDDLESEGRRLRALLDTIAAEARTRRGPV